MTDMKSDFEPLLSEYEFGKLPKSEMIRYLSDLGVGSQTFTTKVTKRELCGFYLRFKEIPLAISLVPPTEDGLHMDFKYRRELLEKAGQNYSRWQHNSGNVKHSHALTSFILDAKSKLDKKESIVIDKEPQVSVHAPMFPPNQATVGIQQIAVKEPEDDIVKVFKYLGDLASKSNAEITIVFKPTF